MTGWKHDEGPDKDGGYGPYIQSERKDIYMKYALELIEKGYAYYCFCTKERLEKIHEEGDLGAGYDRHCRNLSKEEVLKNLAAGIPFVIRQKMEEYAQISKAGVHNLSADFIEKIVKKYLLNG